jgi:hypothetical protein
MFNVLEKDKPLYFVDKEKYQRLDQRNTGFNILKKYPEKFNGRKTLFTNECHIPYNLHADKAGISLLNKDWVYSYVSAKIRPSSHWYFTLTSISSLLSSIIL